MYLTETAPLPLQDLADLLSPPSTARVVEARDVTVNLTGDPSIHIQDDELPLTGAGIVAIGNYLEVPSKFLERLDPDLSETVLTTLLARKAEVVEVAVDEANGGLVDIHPRDVERIPPRSVVAIAQNILGEEADVIGWRRDATAYSFEVTVPALSEVGIGGDAAVGDVTRGGLRFGQDTKHHLSPWVQPYLYRLACTNGMEVPDGTLKINSRGMATADVLSSLEENACAAFGRVETDIENFYALRELRVVHPEQHLTRLASEHGLSDRALASLLRQLPELGEQITLFDLVNLVTNQANNPTMANRFTQQRNFQTVGGSIIHDHPARCTLCASRVA